jgi:uncharacterized membrane protein YfcA
LILEGQRQARLHLKFNDPWSRKWGPVQLRHGRFVRLERGRRVSIQLHFCAFPDGKLSITFPKPSISSHSLAHVPVEHLPLIVATLAFLLAGFVKGVIGLGLPTVSMGLLSVVMPPAKAAPLLIVPSFVTNVWQLAAGPSFGRLARRLWPMLAGVMVGTLAGTGLLTGRHAGQAAVALGFLLMFYAVLGLTSVRFSVSPTAEWWLGPLIGALTGLATAATGVFAIPAVPYLGALNLDKEDMIQALGLSLTVSTIALAAALAAGGAFALGDVGASTAALAPALLGMAAGGALRGQFSEQTLRYGADAHR